MGDTYHDDGLEVLLAIGFMAVGILYITDTFGITIERFVNLLWTGLISGFVVGVGIYVEFHQVDGWIQSLAAIGTMFATPLVGWWIWLNSSSPIFWSMVGSGVLVVGGLHLGLIAIAVGLVWWERRKRKRRSSQRSSSRRSTRARQKSQIDRTSDRRQSDDLASPSSRRQYAAMKREQERINRLNRKP